MKKPPYRYVLRYVHSREYVLGYMRLGMYRTYLRALTKGFRIVAAHVAPRGLGHGRHICGDTHDQ